MVYLMEKFRKSLSLIIFIGICVSYTAQKTQVYTDKYRPYYQGQDLYDKEKFSAAQDKFKETINSLPDKQDEIRINSEYYYAVCALELFHKDAEFLLNRFVTEHPDHPKAKTVYFQLGRQNYRLRKSKKVIEYFKKVDPLDLSAEERVEYYFKLGYSYFREDDYANAKKNFHEILDKESEYNAPATYYYSHIAYTENNFQTALEGFQKIASEPMFSPIVPYYITQIYYKQGRYKQLLEYAPPYMDSVSSKRKSEFAKLIGDSYYHEGEFEKCIPYLLQFRKGSKASRDDNYLLGYAYYRTGQYADAVTYLRRVASKKDGMSQTAYYHMADAYLKLDQKDYALNAFNAASNLDFDPEIKENSLFNYAKLAYELSYNPYDKAIEAFHKYIETYPESPQVEEAYEFLIKVYMTTKNYDQALASLERIKNKDDRMKVAYQTITFNRGVELFHNGQYTNAIQKFKDVKRYPVDKRLNSESVFWIGEAHYHSGEYDKAIAQYVNFRLEPGAALTSVFHDADYNVAYSYFMKAEPFKGNSNEHIGLEARKIQLKNSITAFRNYTQLESRADKRKLQDAYLRLADCYFLLKEDKKAVEFYTTAISKGEGDLSYAYFQKAQSQGVLKDYEGKAKTLKGLLERFPNSIYKIPSIKALANTYRANNENQKALAVYQEFVDNYPQNKFVPDAYVKMAGIHLSDRHYDKAEAKLLYVLNNYPNAETENETAVLLMKDVYEGRGNLEGYYDWLETRGISVAANELDSALWGPVELAWGQGDCNTAIAKAEAYLQKVPNAKHGTEANFYIAQCVYNAGNLEKALMHYNKVVEKVNNNHYVEALRHAGNISFDLKDYRQASGHYTTLEKVAVTQENIRVSVIGQMKCFWELKNYSAAETYAGKVLNLSALDEMLEVEALLIRGISLKEMNQLDDALIYLKECNDKTKSIKGAEAKFYESEIYFLKGEHETCENSIMELVKQKPSYHYWIARGLILLGDNFIAVEDYFNARASLQSIIDNYDGVDKAEIVTMAQEKLDYITELENGGEKRVQQEDEEIDFNGMDEKDKRLFDETDDTQKEKKKKKNDKEEGGSNGEQE